jgi:hypothetical protein
VKITDKRSGDSETVEKEETKRENELLYLVAKVQYGYPGVRFGEGGSVGGLS